MMDMMSSPGVVYVLEVLTVNVSIYRVAGTGLVKLQYVVPNCHKNNLFSSLTNNSITQPFLVNAALYGDTKAAGWLHHNE